MPEADIQALLDAAAADVCAPITLEDRDFRLLAHTDHSGVIDRFREEMIIGRRATPEVREWFEQRRPDKASGPFRTPADKRLGVFERWCVPVTFRGAPLGYLWVLDTRGIAASELASVLDAADQIGALLYRRRLSSQADADLLRLLLIPNLGDDSAAAEARGLGTFVHDGPVTVVVVGTVAGDDLTSAALGDLSLIVHRAAEQALPGTVLAGIVADVGVLLTPLRRRNDLEPARRLSEAVCRLAGQLGYGLEVVVGIGGARKLDGASHSYVEARRTVRMIRAMPDLGPIALWDDLGVFRALALLPTNDLDSGVLDRRVRELIADATLAETAETFLDLAGDVQETAAAIFVHRATLYQRLDRINAVYGLDLRKNGDHRLITHLGLKLARVADVRTRAHVATVPAAQAREVS